jgi:hypothetical protein
MTTEPTQPQSELGPVQAIGQGQSQGHRRRRRRRKNKSSQQSAPQMQQPTAQQPESPQAAIAPPKEASPAHTAHGSQRQTPRQGSQQGPQQGSQQGPRQGSHAGAHQAAGQGRKKKKFFTKAAPTAAQPGNSLSSPAAGKRKGKQRGPREFVGPMDHSYRIVNGNIADGPPSTIQISSNGHSGGHYQENFAPVATVPVRENTPTRIFCFIEDLFFLAKIQETARKLGVKVEFVKGDKESVAKLTDLPEEERPKLVVFDLNNLAAKPIALIPKLKTKLKKGTSIIGFLNHLQGELKAKAIDAGCDTVMPRSAFSQSLPNLLRRYGLEEEEDNMPQPM